MTWTATASSTAITRKLPLGDYGEADTHGLIFGCRAHVADACVCRARRATMPFMSAIRCMVLLTVSLSFGGCTFSVHPILTEADLTTDIDLTGKWELLPPPESKETPRTLVSLAGYSKNSSYDATVDGKQQRYDLRIGRFGDHRYIQMIQAEAPFNDGLPIVPVYCFGRFDVVGDELRVFFAVDERVRAILKQKRLPYRELEGTTPMKWLVLTSATAELQALVRDSGDEIFNKTPLVYRRVVMK